MLKKYFKVMLLMLAFTLSLSCVEKQTVKKPGESPEAGKAVLINDFEGGSSQTPFGGSWFSYNDAANGGDSIVKPNPFGPIKGDGANGSSYFAQMTGTVTTKFQYGFIGIGCDIVSNLSVMDISSYNGIKFFTRGDGKSYSVKLRTTNIKDFDYFSYTFTAPEKWQEVKIPLKSFKQEGWGQKKILSDSLKFFNGIQFQTIGQPISSVRLEIDDIYLY